ncbi:MAG: hypothetical protein LW817_01645 [Candidatus Caenarcaniphilales bacterium]|jgi:hypothetical protein|nr:hypothetical protein [Candidatus Caenarcaniphilales bacterium]
MNSQNHFFRFIQVTGEKVHFILAKYNKDGVREKLQLFSDKFTEISIKETMIETLISQNRLSHKIPARIFFDSPDSVSHSRDYSKNFLSHYLESWLTLNVDKDALIQTTDIRLAEPFSKSVFVYDKTQNQVTITTSMKFGSEAISFTCKYEDLPEKLQEQLPKPVNAPSDLLSRLRARTQAEFHQ